MNNTLKTVKLEKGEVTVYDYGEVKLHAYKTNDPLADEVFIVEKKGQAVIIESPCFFDNETALSSYLDNLNVTVDGILVAYHAAGGNFLPNVKKYGTATAKTYAENGGGKALIDNFTAAFGSSFDSKLHVITEILPSGSVTIGGIDFVIKPNDEAYTIEIPEINAVYTHMLGHDCHSIVADDAHADAIISELRGYIARGFGLILTSHYTPENLKDADTKIRYIETLKYIAKKCGNADGFKRAVNDKYPDYSGKNYLDMTATMFFKG